MSSEPYRKKSPCKAVEELPILDFIMKHEEVTRLQNAGELSLLEINLYEYLAHRADARTGTGKIKRILVNRAARDLKCTRQAIHKCSSKLRALGLLAGGGEEGDNCLAGFLPHIALLSGGKGKASASSADIAKAKTDAEKRAVASAVVNAPKTKPNTEQISKNGNGTVTAGEALAKSPIVKKYRDLHGV